MRGGRAPAAAVVALVVGGCGSAASTTPATSTVTVTTQASRPHPPPPPPRPKPRPKPKPRPDPGKLPQTDQTPSSNTLVFHAEMAALWNGVVRDSVHAALPAFFPEAAYLQVKSIGDPAGDWSGRLVRDYELDLSAAHGLLGANPSQARLLRVVVPADYAHWVDPGACYNDVGYYEVPNSRVVYKQGGEVRSFGIASMISWRGVWYVIHLGAIVGPSGVVDDPSSGEGYSSASSTC